MRVSTTLIHTQGVQNMLEQQTKLYRTQAQVASGHKYLAPSDNPGAASRIIDLNEAITQLTQYEENASYATQRLGVEESVLDSVENVLQRVRELAVQAGNQAVHDVLQREAIANELREKLDELFDYANTKEANGEYLFSGFQSSTQPFATNGVGAYTYNGDQGQIALQIGSNRQVVANDSGAEIFQLIRNGNGDFSVDTNIANTGNGIITTGSVVNPAVYQSHDFTIRFTSATTFEVDNNTTGAVNILGVQTYTEGAAISFNGVEVSIEGTPATGDSFTVTASRYQDMFSSIYDLIDTLETSPNNVPGRAQYQQGIANALNNFDRALDNVINVRTSVGGRMNSIDSQVEENEARKIQLQSVLSQVRDLDYAEAVSNLSFQSTALQIAQQSFAKVQSLSLFNFI